MSESQAKALVERLTTDEAFRQRLDEAPHADKRSILEAEGYGDVRLRHVSAALPQSVGGELSDEEFASVAGGGSASSDAWVASVVASGPVVVSLVAASAVF